MTQYGAWNANWGTKKGLAKQKVGFEIVAGELADEDTADLLTCDAAQFEAQMAQRYADWRSFVIWAEDLWAEHRAALDYERLLARA